MSVHPPLRTREVWGILYDPTRHMPPLPSSPGACVQIPTLIVQGARDGVVDNSTALREAEAQGCALRARFVLADQAGHLFPWTHVGATWEIIASFHADGE